jgi:hypothetical protein
MAGNNPRKVVATWEEADAETLWRAIAAVTDAGDAIMFGRTRDEGAVVLTLLSGDERIRQYATGVEEIAELLRAVRESVEADL